MQKYVKICKNDLQIFGSIRKALGNTNNIETF